MKENTPEQDRRATIKDWTDGEKPRERLAKLGARALTDAELVAILLRTGTREENAVDIARRMLAEFGSITNLSSAEIESLKKYKGIGRDKAVTLAAAFELGKRIEGKEFDKKETIREPKDIAEKFIPRMRDLKKEEFWVVYLNTANQVIRDENISVGGLNVSVVEPREAFRGAIMHNAAAVILLHNHPSGNPEPSREDIALTKSFVEAGETLHIPVHDHLIIAGNTYTSLKQRRLM
ncbi:MAG TPA: DNA repair protein RadC [Candidatus Kapabacteria bacterium]|nr:DNA repair protein RadC [Candidatus Kapabacteria bacterium]